ncbi:putative metallothiol transferase fosB [Mycobacterium xenopi 4042]|uniref:Putative metallothiol transferase fosB n=1 Tax=Mycobacterium xenopi 4042 TaxID=1299334 RepID=X8E0K9_MYCXE|nr:putative metallothiol transferase fosB [Mycobacterium xenopi 4042]
MGISFNHTIVAARDKKASAQFLTELFGLPDPVPVGRFMAVTLEHGATLDYADVPEGKRSGPALRIPRVGGRL